MIKVRSIRRRLPRGLAVACLAGCIGGLWPVGAVPLRAQAAGHGNEDRAREEAPARVALRCTLLPRSVKADWVHADVHLSLIGGRKASVTGVDAAGVFSLTLMDIHGVQAAGVFNKVDGSVAGVQAAGVFQTVQGDMTGLQAAGVFNIVDGHVCGVQAAGVFQSVKGDVAGVQAAGVGNIVRGSLRGVQSAGVFNIADGAVAGYQEAGVFNIARGDVSGYQEAGVFNITDGSLAGLQEAGVFNMVKGDVAGAQAAGVFNIADGNVAGAQAAGVFNITREHVAGLQAAGVFNIARGEVAGVQAAGVFNMADGDVKGLQAAGVFNVAKGRVHGVQAGLVNVAESSDLPLGLVNIIGDGKIDVSVSSSEFFVSSLALRTGNQRVYSVLSAGLDPFEGPLRWSTGWGLGVRLPFRGAWSGNVDFLGSRIHAGLQADESIRHHLMGRFWVEYAIKGPWSLFAGASYNVLRCAPEGPEPAVPSWTHRQTETVANRVYEWIGVQGGLQLTLR